MISRCAWHVQADLLTPGAWDACYEHPWSSQTCLHRPGLEQVAFDGVGSMPMARIDTIRVTKQADVDVELAKRSRNKQLREAVSMSERHAAFSSQGDALPNML